jgi:hypothetical protein
VVQADLSTTQLIRPRALPDPSRKAAAGASGHGRRPSKRRRVDVRKRGGGGDSEMLEHLVAQRYCAYLTAPMFRDALTNQLADIQALKTDAQSRGWADEAARHERVAFALNAASAWHLPRHWVNGQVCSAVVLRCVLR